MRFASTQPDATISNGSVLDVGWTCTGLYALKLCHTVVEGGGGASQGLQHDLTIGRLKIHLGQNNNRLNYVSQKTELPFVALRYYSNLATLSI